MDFGSVTSENLATDMSAIGVPQIVALQVVTVEYQRAVCDVLLMLRHRVQNDGLTITIAFKDRNVTIDCSQFDRPSAP